MDNSDEIKRQKQIEEERNKYLSEEEKKRYRLEQEHLQNRSLENIRQAPTNVFDGINQDQFTKRSHEAILSNLRNEGVEDIDEIDEEDEEDYYTPSRYY